MSETVLERDKLSGTSEWDRRLDLGSWDAPLSKCAEKVDPVLAQGDVEQVCSGTQLQYQRLILGRIRDLVERVPTREPGGQADQPVGLGVGQRKVRVIETACRFWVSHYLDIIG